MFESSNLADWAIGLILLIISLLLLCGCLVGMVKVLSAIFKGSVSKIIQKIVNSDPPGLWKYTTGFISMIVS